MSNSTDEPLQSTPIFDQTVQSTTVEPAHLAPIPAGDSQQGDQAKQAAVQAKDTVQDAAGQAKGTVQDAAGQAKEQAKDLGGAAADAGQRVASTTKDQASRVATDALSQARQLYGQATDQLSEQAGKQQQNAASTLRTLGDDLSGMGAQSEGGLAAELVQTLSARASGLAAWLEQREPGEVLDEVTQFAARRPGLFIGLAAVTGIVAARATKALMAGAKSDEPPAAGTDGLDGEPGSFGTVPGGAR